MEKIICHPIITDKMYVEKCEMFNLDKGHEKETYKVSVGRGVSPIWYGFICLHESNDLQAG